MSSPKIRVQGEFDKPIVAQSGTVFLRAEYNYDMFTASLESGLKCEDPSLTRQSEAEDADINVLVKRFGLGQPLPQGVRMPQSGDFTGVSNFHEAMNVVIAARESFAVMPAEVRSRFGNDPGAFVDFCLDEKNRDEALKLGLVEKPLPVVEEPPVRVEVVAPVAPAAPVK